MLVIIFTRREKMKAFKVLFIFLVLFIFGGCAGLKNVISKSKEVVDEFNKIVPSVKELVRNMQQASNEFFYNNGIDNNKILISDNSSIEKKIIDISIEMIELKPFEVEVLFPKNEYSLKKSEEAIYFITVIQTFLDQLKNNILKNYNVSFIGEFEGGTDASKNRGFIGIYKGEYGNILEKNVIINENIVEKYELPKNSKIKNEDLAFLRAYNVYNGLLFQLNKVNMSRDNFKSIKFIAREHFRIGKTFRYGRVKVIIDKSSMFSKGSQLTSANL